MNLIVRDGFDEGERILLTMTRELVYYHAAYWKLLKRLCPEFCHQYSEEKVHRFKGCRGQHPCRYVDMINKDHRRMHKYCRHFCIYC